MENNQDENKTKEIKIDIKRKKTSKWVKVLIISIIVLLIILITIRILGCFKFTYNLWFSKESQNLVTDRSYSNVDTIKINVDRANIYINESEDNDVHLKMYTDSKSTNVKLYNTKLNIITNVRCKFCMGNSLANIEVKIPKNYDGVINIINYYGNIFMNDFSDTNLISYNKFGNVNIENCNVGYIKTLYGNININNINDAKIRETIGDTKINNVNKLTIDSALSNVNVGNVTKYINSEIDYGSISIDKLNIDRDSEIDNKFGNIKIKDKGDFNIRLNDNDSDDDYEYTLDIKGNLIK